MHGGPELATAATPSCGVFSTALDASTAAIAHRPPSDSRTRFCHGISCGFVVPADAHLRRCHDAGVDGSAGGSSHRPEQVLVAPQQQTSVPDISDLRAMCCNPSVGTICHLTQGCNPKRPIKDDKSHTAGAHRALITEEEERQTCIKLVEAGVCPRYPAQRALVDASGCFNPAQQTCADL